MFAILLFSCQEKESKKTEETDNAETLILPEYEIIDETLLISGEKVGEVLIQSFSRNTPVSEREKVLREIAKIKGYEKAYLYSTRESQKANFSDSFRKKHPDALKTGYLGSLNKGNFIPGEEIYP
jgi:hypothetical protein